MNDPMNDPVGQGEKREKNSCDKALKEGGALQTRKTQINLEQFIVIRSSAEEVFITLIY